MNRLVQLIAAITKSHGGVWGKLCILGLDHHYEKSGVCLRGNTGIYVPNEYIFKAACEFPAYFGMQRSREKGELEI